MENLTTEIVGWAARATEKRPNRTTVSALFANILSKMGVTDAFGIVGGGNAPFAEALLHSPIRVWHTRHEAGAAFAAAEASFASGAPAAVFVTTGPGLMNALNGICAARWDGAKVIVMSGCTNPEQKGRWAVQETSSYTMPMGDLFSKGAFFDYATQLGSEAELMQVARRLQKGFARPQGFIAHISIPLTLQTALLAQSSEPPNTSMLPFDPAPVQLNSCSVPLANEHFAIWLGYGARNAVEEVHQLVDLTGAAVMCTPRAKGLFPETHPQYVGVTGAGGHKVAGDYMNRCQPAYTLVLGSRLGEASSFWSDDLIPRRGFIHVDVDPTAVGIAYPDVPVVGVQAEIKAFLKTLNQILPYINDDERPEIVALPKPPQLEPRDEGDLRPQYLMQMLQEKVIDTSDAIVMSESGNSFAWANHYLRFNSPDQYRTSAEYGSMGHVTTGVVGAALAADKRSFAIVGDGAMLMNNEISTAVRYRAKAVWLVLNDSRYGITQQAMKAQGFWPVETEIPPTNFAMYAKAMGCAGVQVTRESELAAALDQALNTEGPFVIDAIIDRSEISPVLKSRIDNLKKQGAVGTEFDA